MSKRTVAAVGAMAILVFCTSVAFARPMSAMQSEEEVVDTIDGATEEEIVVADPTPLDECETDGDTGETTDGDTGETTDGDPLAATACEDVVTEPDAGDDEESEEGDEEGDDGSAANHGKAVSTAAHCKGLKGRARGALVSSIARDKTATVETAQAACDAALAEQEAAGATAVKVKRDKPVKVTKAPKVREKTISAPKVKAAKPTKPVKPVKPATAPKAHPNKP